MTTIIQHEIKSHFHPLSMGEITDIVTEVCLDLPILCALVKLIPISKPPPFANQLLPSAMLLARQSSLSSPFMGI